MAGSSNKINYALRTSKSIERKMMCEMIACLENFSKVSAYRYIGMGSKFFADFILMHKMFAITDMISLEISDEKNDIDRFEFNKPFNCINVIHKSSKDWLNSSEVSWEEKRGIIWFDYDDPLSFSQIEDLELCVKKVKSGSMVFISTNIFRLKKLGEKPKERLENYVKIINNSDYTNHLTPKDMKGKNELIVVADTFNVAVKNAISERNKTIHQECDYYSADQVAFFSYSDSSPMITLGWIIFNNSDEEKIKKCGIDELDFYRKSGEAPYSIEVPILTYKELAVLNKNMPDPSFPIKEADFLTKNEIEEYKRIYRYYPTTIETGLIL